MITSVVQCLWHVGDEEPDRTSLSFACVGGQLEAARWIERVKGVDPVADDVAFLAAVEGSIKDTRNVNVISVITSPVVRWFLDEKVRDVRVHVHVHVRAM